MNVCSSVANPQLSSVDCCLLVAWQVQAPKHAKHQASKAQGGQEVLSGAGINSSNQPSASECVGAHSITRRSSVLP